MGDYEKGYREAWMPLSGTESTAEMDGRRAARNGGLSPTSGGNAGLALIGFAILIYLLVLLAGGVCIAILALFGTPVLLAVGSLSTPATNRMTVRRAYGTMCIGLYFNVVLVLLFLAFVGQMPGANVPRAESFADMLRWSALAETPAGAAALGVVQLFAVMAFAAVARSRSPAVFSGPAGFVKALVASILSLAVSLGVFALFIATRTDGDGVEEIGTKILAVSLVVGVYALVGAPVGAVAILVTDRTAAPRDRHSLWRALMAGFAALSAYGVAVVMGEAVSPALVPMARTLRDAYKAARGLPPPLGVVPGAPSVLAVTLEQALAFAVMILVLTKLLGSGYQGAIGRLRSAAVAGSTSMVMAVIFVLTWLASPASKERSEYPSPAMARPIQIAASTPSRPVPGARPTAAPRPEQSPGEQRRRMADHGL